MLVSLFQEGQGKVEVGAKRKSQISVELKKFAKKKNPCSFTKTIKGYSTRFSSYSLMQKWPPFRIYQMIPEINLKLCL